jgi:two-component system, NarL family, sensor kinase
MDHQPSDAIPAGENATTTAPDHARALAALRERVKELDCLYAITRLSQRQDLALDDILAGAVAIVACAWQYPEITCARVTVGGRSCATPNIRKPRHRQTSPIRVCGETVGRIEVGYLEDRPDCDEGPFLREERHLLDAVADHLGRILEARQNEDRLRTLSRELIKAQETERQRIARELHDNAAQELSMLRMGMEGLPGRIIACVGESGRDAAKSAQALCARLTSVISSLRDLSYDLLPPALDQLGLAETAFRLCEDFAARHGIEVDCFADGMEAVRPGFATSVNLYRVLQEALTNTRKHAQATRVTVRLVASHPNIILRVQDNGRGFDPQTRLPEALAEKHMGLWSMRERVRLLGGRLTIRAKAGKGACILVEAPCAEAT